MARRNSVCLSLVCFLAVAVAACGGNGSTGKVDPPPAPPSISLALSCAENTLGVGGTTQCTATVTPTGASAVNLTASAGTITSAGLYTAPATIPAASEAVTVTATAMANTAKTATAKLTVNGGKHLASIAPYLFWPSGHPGWLGTVVTATGLVDGDAIIVAPTNLGLLDGATTVQGGMSLRLVLGPESMSPGWVSVTAKSHDGSIVSNTLNTVLISNNNALSVCSDRVVIADEADGLPNGQNGIIREYGLDGTVGTSFRVGDGRDTVECDKKLNEILTTQRAYSFSGIDISALGNVSDGAPTGVGTGMGNFCILTFSDLAGCGGPITATIPSFTTVPTGTGLASIAMSPASNMAQVYANGSNELWWIQAPDATVLGHVSLSGVLTPQSALQPGQGGWPGVVFGSGNRAGYSALLSIPDEKLVIALGEAVTSTIDLKPIAPEGATPIMIVADEPMGTIIVGFADDTAKVGRFISIDPLTGTVTAIAATSVSAPVGMGVSADGKTLYVGSRDAAPDILSIE